MDGEGYIDHGAVIYHTVFGDSEGNPTEKVWLADRILLDNRIPPKEYSIEKYNFTIPKNTKSPLLINVKLNYVSASQKLSDLLFGKGSIKPPVIEMASANATLDIPATKEMPGFTFVPLMTILLYIWIKRQRLFNF